MDNRSNNNNNDFSNNNEEFNDMLNEYYNSKLKQKWAEQLEKEHSVVRHRAPLTRRKVVSLVTSIAAAFAVLLIMNTSLNPFNSGVSEFAENLITETPLTLSGDMATRGSQEDQSTNEALQSALEAQAYDEVINIYEQQGSIESLSVSNKFYLGVSHIKAENGNIDQGIQLLSEISGERNAFQLDAQWFLALAHLKNKNIDEGKKQLLDLRERSNYQDKKIKKLLEKI